MFEYFFLGIQQDIKLAVLAPVVCALFRLAFIGVYRPKKRLAHDAKRIIRCFQFGFWWGMDFNAYAFLLPMLLVSVPGAFLDSYYAMGDAIRLAAGMIYATVLYCAFVGKMIFYNHFHDIYNHILRLGQKAEKHNLVDIFFHQDHGAWILLGLIPYWGICYGSLSFLLGLPSVTYPNIEAGIVYYLVNTVIVLGLILGFYWFRYGGTLSHDDKPEWDTIPSLVKKDIFFAKATVDDLVALEQVKKRKLNDAYTHTDAQDLQSIFRLQFL